MVSNALDRSKNMPKVDSFLSIAEDKLVIRSIKSFSLDLVQSNDYYGIQIFSSIRYYASSRIQSVGCT